MKNMSGIECNKEKTGLRRRCAMYVLAGAAGLACLLLFFLKRARYGLYALYNQLCTASEARNAYVYTRLTVPEDTDTGMALACLAAAGLSLFLLVVLLRRPWLWTAFALCTVLFQVYYGLAFADWLNVLLSACAVCGLLRTGREGKAALVGLFVLVMALCAVLFPGTDTAMEEASEKVRDRISALTGTAVPETREMSLQLRETRHVNPLSERKGENTGETMETYRLKTEVREDISMPRTLQVLKTILLLAAVVLLVVLPFVPFWLLDRQKRRAAVMRKDFEDADLSLAVKAIFRHATAYLAWAGLGGRGLYRDWDRVREMPAPYPEQYAKAVAVFEEAAYSSHALGEEARQEMLDFLEATEKLVYDPAPFLKKLDLRYRRCLHA